MPQKTFTDHFARVSEDYATYRPVYPAELFGWLAVTVPGRKLVWDCATGSGQAAVALADYFETVWATDASSAQIASAAEKSNIEYHVASADSSKLPEQSADLVTVAQALHWFDLNSFYSEVRRVLKPGGFLAVWTYGIFRAEGEYSEKIQQLLDQFYYETVGSCWPPERHHVENGYSDLFFPFEELVPPEFAMSVDWTLDNLAGYLRSWSATSRYKELHSADPVIPLIKELEAIWGNSRRKVVWPLSIKVGKK